VKYVKNYVLVLERGSVKHLRNGGIMLENLEKRLVSMKEEIDKSKERLSELKGRREALNEELKNEYGLKSIKEAEAFLAEAEKQASLLTEEIKNGIRKIEENYNV